MMDIPKAFDEPWQAQIFALTIALSETGHFGWPAWTEAFGATLKARGASRMLDGGDDYWQAWLGTLEQMLARAGLAGHDEVEAMRLAWRSAYLATPHGQPVRLSE